MDAATATPSKTGGRFDLLLGHCFALDAEPRPTARHRLEAVLGHDLTRRLMQALSTPR